MESILLIVNVNIPPSQEILLHERGSESNAMGFLFIQEAFLISAENVSAIYNNNRMINFSLQILQATSYQNKEVPCYPILEYPAITIGF